MLDMDAIVVLLDFLCFFAFPDKFHFHECFNGKMIAMTWEILREIHQNISSIDCTYEKLDFISIF